MGGGSLGIPGDSRFARITMGGGFLGIPGDSRFARITMEDCGASGARLLAGLPLNKKTAGGTLAVFFLRSGRDSNSRYAFGAHTLSRQLSPIVNDWLIISCLKPVPACAYVARKIYAAKLIIFFDVAITFAPFLSFFFLNVRDSIGC